MNNRLLKVSKNLMFFSVLVEISVSTRTEKHKVFGWLTLRRRSKPCVFLSELKSGVQKSLFFQYKMGGTLRRR